MKLVQHKALVLAIALASLAGCRTADMEKDSEATSAQSTTYSSPGQQMDRMDQQAGSATAGASTGAQRGMDAAQPNAVVMNIETVSRSSMMGGTGAGTSGTSGTAGTTGTSDSDRLYRITVRMDDGSSRTLMQERAPSFRPGDRVTVSNDMVVEQ